MKKSKYALLSLTLVISIVVILVGSFKINKTEGIVEVENSDFYACSPGVGTYYIVNASSLNVRSTPNSSIDTNIVGQRHSGDWVTVYCTTNGWARISNTSNEYAYMSYLNRVDPSVTVGNLSFSPSPAYRNNNYSGSLDVNIQNLPDAGSRVVISIVNSSGGNAEGSFNVSKSHNHISFSRKNSTVSGTFRIVVRLDGSEIGSRSFTIEKNEFNFNVSKYSEKDSYAENEQGQWEFSLTNLVPSGLSINDFSYQIKKGTTDCTSDFTTYIENGKLIVRNKMVDTIFKGGKWVYDREDYTKQGTYTIYFTFNNQGDYSGHNGFTKSDTMKITLRKATITESAAERQYTRYQIDYENQDYNLDIVGKTVIDGVTKYVIDERINSKVTREYFTEWEMKQTFPNIRLDKDSIYFETRATRIEDGYSITPVAVNFGDSIYITNFTKTAAIPEVTYYLGASSTPITIDAVTFEKENPSAYEKLLVGTENSVYNYKTNGDIVQNEIGKGTKIIKKIASIPNKTPRSVTGGEILMTVRLRGFIDDELQGFKVILEKMNGTKATSLYETEGTKVHDPNFEVVFNNSGINEGKIYIIIKYKDNDDSYTGDYRVRYGFKNYNYNTQFRLEDGNVDYTIFSEVDTAATSDDPLEGVYPGANQKYNYNIGLYMKKTGTDYYKLNLNTIGYKIYDRRVDKTADGQYYFYDEIEYITKVTRIAGGKVYFDLSTDNGVNYLENQVLSVNDFAEIYSEAYEYFKDNKYYNLDASGNVIGDKYSIHPVKMFAANKDATDMSLTYTVSGVTKTVVMDNTFKRANPEMYSMISTRFAYDSKGEYVLGAIKGRRKDNIVFDTLENHDVSDLFYVKKAERDPKITDPNSQAAQTENEEIAKKTLTILPKTEVDAGEYYIYITAQELGDPVGYLYTDNTDDAAIEIAIYPELWQRNIHMTSIKYDKPVYSIDVDDAIKSNSVNDLALAYANARSYITFNMTLKYIYNRDNLNYHIEYNDNGKWVNGDCYFNIADGIHTSVEVTDATLDTKGLTSSTLTLTTIQNNNESDKKNTKKGKYRLVMDYSNNGITMNTVIKEFDITANNYSINIDPDEVVRLTNDGEVPFETFYSNQKYDIKIPIHLYTVEHPENIEFELVYKNTTDINQWIPDSKEFRSYRDRDIVAFKYTEDLQSIEGNPDEQINYIKLSNYIDSLLPQADEGDYVLKVKYQEAGGILAETTFSFTVSKPKREFNPVEGKDVAKSTPDEMYFTREIESSYIVGTKLLGDDVSYAIEMYKNGQYTDVSSEDSDIRYFEISSMKWKDTDVADRINYYGDMKINLAVDKIDSIFENSDQRKFLLVITMSNVRYEMPMPNLRELFKWQIDSVDITGELESEGGKIDVSGFYNNAKPKLDIKLTTPHEENAKYAITQECSGNVCTPNENMITYNDRFELISQTSDEIVIKLKDNLSPQLKLALGKYQLVVYYSETDYDIKDFTIRNEFLSIEFGETTIETPVKDGISNDLFVNKNSTIRIPVDVVGTSYDNVTIDISNNNQSVNYNHLFNINKNKFINDHILEITYDSSKEIDAIDYLVMVHRTVDGEIIEDHEVLKFNDTYFNYVVKDITYDPDPAVPNYETGGKIIFDISTDELMTGNLFEDRTTKRAFVENLIVNHSEIPDNLNNKFEITYEEKENVNDFRLIFRYSYDDQIWPGDYIVTMNVAKNTYSLQKKYNFFVDTFERNISIDRVTIDSNTKDELIHKNTGGTYIVDYTANYDIDTKNLYVKVTDNENKDVTDKFVINKDTNGKALLTFDPNLHAIDYGIYTITLTYADPVTHRDNATSTDIIMYGDYKEIVIKDINPNVYPILAENEGQYYDFNLDTSNLTEEEIKAMKIRVYDSENNIVSSNIASDKVDNVFEITKNTGNNYRINILPYKARVGLYFVEFTLPASFDPNNLGLQNVSNRLEFSVDDTLYNIVLASSSSIVTQDRINNTDDIYDYIGVNGDYNFTSSSPIKDEYSIKIFNKLKLVKEISVDASENGSLEKIPFSVDEITNGDVEFALCIRGLPYASITKSVLEYIKITDLVLVMDYRDVGDELTLDPEDVKTFDLVVTPNNATNKNLVYTAKDNGIVTFNGNTVTVIGPGETEVTVGNKEITKTFKLIVSEILDSTSYEVDQNEKTIFVNHMESKMMSKTEFIRNISHLSKNYQILDKNNNNVTSTTEVIGTGYKIVNGNYTYTVIVLGDINGDGMISLIDATQVFRYYRGYENLTGIKKKAAIITRGSQIRNIDATKLYRFYRGYEYEI